MAALFESRVTKHMDDPLDQVLVLVGLGLLLIVSGLGMPADSRVARSLIATGGGFFALGLSLLR